MCLSRDAEMADVGDEIQSAEVRVASVQEDEGKRETTTKSYAAALGEEKQALNPNADAYLSGSSGSDWSGRTLVTQPFADAHLPSTSQPPIEYFDYASAAGYPAAAMYPAVIGPPQVGSPPPAMYSPPPPHLWMMDMCYLGPAAGQAQAQAPAGAFPPSWDLSSPWGSPEKAKRRRERGAHHPFSADIPMNREKRPVDPTFAFDVEEARNGGGRATIMIKNIPNKYNQEMLLRKINTSFQGMYDFLYLPIDFKNKCNLGYAFVNFTDSKSAADFYEAFHNQRWSEFNSKKVCEITYGRVQGIKNLVQHFKNSRFPCSDPACLPLIISDEARD